MAKYNLLSLLVALAAAFSSVSLAFISPLNKRPIPSSPLAMSSSTSNRRPKRTVNDRSSQEARDLIRDIVEAAFDAGEDNM